MSALDLAAVVVVVVTVAAVTLAAVATWSLLRAARELRRASVAVQDAARAASAELDALTNEVRGELVRTDDLLARAEGITSTLEGASRLTYLAVSAPVIRAAAVANGVRRGARRLRDQSGYAARIGSRPQGAQAQNAPAPDAPASKGEMGTERASGRNGEART